MISTYAKKLFKATIFDGVIDPYKARVFGRATMIWATINIMWATNHIHTSYSYFHATQQHNRRQRRRPTPTTASCATMPLNQTSGSKQKHKQEQLLLLQKFETHFFVNTELQGRWMPVDEIVQYLNGIDDGIVF